MLGKYCALYLKRLSARINIYTDTALIRICVYPTASDNPPPVTAHANCHDSACSSWAKKIDANAMMHTT